MTAVSDQVIARSVQESHPEMTLSELKGVGFDGVIADGQLSSGTTFEIRFSRKSAVTEGVHILMIYPGVAALTDTEQVEAYATMIRFVRKDPLAQEFGFRYAENFGVMLTRPEPHSHVIIPGSLAEREQAPRMISRWGE